MSRYRLPGGTDAAEMALFDIDALPQRLPDAAGIARLVQRQRLIRLSTGGDGGYLLHLYVDEAVPVQIAQYCSDADVLRGQFVTERGQVGFGGIESACLGFQPNVHIRADAQIAAGEYRFIAWHTEFPEHLIIAALGAANSPTARTLLQAPRSIILIAAVVTIALALSGFYFGAALALVVAGVAVQRILHSAGYQNAKAHAAAARLDFPGMVIELQTQRDGEGAGDLKPAFSSAAGSDPGLAAPV